MVKVSFSNNNCQTFSWINWFDLIKFYFNSKQLYFNCKIKCNIIDITEIWTCSKYPQISDRIRKRRSIKIRKDLSFRILILVFILNIIMEILEDNLKTLHSRSTKARKPNTMEKSLMIWAWDIIDPLKFKTKLAESATLIHWKEMTIWEAQNTTLVRNKNHRIYSLAQLEVKEASLNMVFRVTKKVKC